MVPLPDFPNFANKKKVQNELAQRRRKVAIKFKFQFSTLDPKIFHNMNHPNFHDMDHPMISGLD